tara:strand:+ start:1118 stop:2014 length:897 start_codon:yes stop_codon:yes gene_type:complete
MTNNKPLVSIIVNCYNGSKYLFNCLTSIQQQTYNNYEVIFWDNFSTDNSKSIFNQFNDNRFLYFNDYSHSKLYHARFKALSKAKGDLIAFLDVDDLWQPSKLSLQVSAMNSNPSFGYCYTGFKILNQINGTLKSAYNNQSLKSGYIARSLLNRYTVGMLTLMVNRQVIIENNINFNQRFNMIGDFDFVIRLSRISRGFVIPEDLAIYRKHSSNLSFINREEHFEERKEWLKDIKNEDIFPSQYFDNFINETNYQKVSMNLNNLSINNQILSIFKMKGIFIFKLFVILIKFYTRKIFRF